MLFLIHLIGGFYCSTQLIKEDAMTRLILSVFFGWIFIVVYIIKLYLESDTGSATNSFEADSVTKHTYTGTAEFYTESSSNYYEPDYQNSNRFYDDEPGWSHADLCDYYGCGEDDWPCD